MVEIYKILLVNGKGKFDKDQLFTICNQIQELKVTVKNCTKNNSGSISENTFSGKELLTSRTVSKKK